MKQLQLAGILALASLTAAGQKTIKGAYEGELVVPKSVLLINQQKDSVIKGMVYSSQLEHVPFYGIYRKQEVRGTIFMPPDQGDIVILYGKLNKDTIEVTLVSSLDSAVMVKSKLIKVSGSVNYNLSKTYGKIVPQYDEQLIGTWVYLYTIKEDGQKTEELPMMAGMSVEYLANGLFTITIPQVEALLAKHPLPLSQRPYTRQTWYTRDGKLISKSEIHFPQSMAEKAAEMGFAIPSTNSDEFIRSYQVKGDTLITTDKKLSKTYYIKKKKPNRPPSFSRKAPRQRLPCQLPDNPFWKAIGA